MMDKFSDLDRHVEQRVQANMRELARLCRQPSIAAQGLGIRECGNALNWSPTYCNRGASLPRCSRQQGIPS
jgi:ribonuclease I